MCRLPLRRFAAARKRGSGFQLDRGRRGHGLSCEAGDRQRRPLCDDGKSHRRHLHGRQTSAARPITMWSQRSPPVQKVANSAQVSASFPTALPTGTCRTVPPLPTGTQIGTDVDGIERRGKLQHQAGRDYLADLTPRRAIPSPPGYTNTGLNNGTTYYYVVSAVNSSGESADSSETSATTSPAAPTGLTAVAGPAQMTLNWSASAGASSYIVKRSTTSGGPDMTVAVR